jgi:glycerol-3-phosphate dehydrogenase
LSLPARFVGATLQADGSTIRYRDAAGERECEAGVLINAAGSWAPRVALSPSPGIPVPSLELVQGTHVIIDGQVTQGIYYVESPRDGRAVFFMPWKSRTGGHCRTAVPR